MTLNLTKMLGLGAVVLTLTAGSAFAASTSGGLTVYSGPSDTSAPVGVIHGQQTFSVAKRSGGFCEITSPKAGWVDCTLLNDAPRTNMISGPATTDVSPIYTAQDDPVQADHNY
jgi:hypothetical protein